MLKICVKGWANIAKLLSSALTSSTFSDFLKQPPHSNKTAQDFSYKCMHGENNKKHLQIFEVPIMLWNINIYVLNIKYTYLCALSLNRISLHDEYLLDSSPCVTCVCKNICFLPPIAAQENYFYVALATNANDAMRWK